MWWVFGIGMTVGVVFGSPVFFLLGMFVASDSKVTHEKADISRALKRPR